MKTAPKLLALSDDALRCEVTKALEPGPWKHKVWPSMDDQVKGGAEGAWPVKSMWNCTKCNQWLVMDLEHYKGNARSMGAIALDYFSDLSCPIPDAAEGSWADLRSRLLRHCHHVIAPDIRRGSYHVLRKTICSYANTTDDYLYWMTCEDRDAVIVCLLALRHFAPEKGR
jgi:hypothetical protein